jgi:hypothetical protein
LPHFRKARRLLCAAAMTPLKTALAVGAAWTMGLASFGFFLDTLRDPVAPPAVTEAPPALAKLVAEPPTRPIIELEPVVIVATKPRRAPTAQPNAEVAWSCAEWRTLVQGDVGSQVRACEPEVAPRNP